MFRPAPRAATAAVVAVMLAALAAAACRDVTAPTQDPTTVSYAPALNIRLSDFTRDTSGVYYRDIAVGSGTVAVSGDVIRYFYTGYLTDGRRFGSDISTTGVAAVPDTFVVGKGGVIPGFERGLLGVRAGGRRRLIIPPALGYGNTSRGSGIPAGSILIFDVDVPAVVAPATTTTSAVRTTR